jgi:hypothetical protein
MEKIKSKAEEVLEKWAAAKPKQDEKSGHPWLGALTGGPIGALAGAMYPEYQGDSMNEQLLKSGLGGALGLGGGIHLSNMLGRKPTGGRRLLPIYLATLLGGTGGLALSDNDPDYRTRQAIAGILGGIGGLGAGGIAGNMMKG